MSRSKGINRVGLITVIAAVAGGVLTFVEHRILWGYWGQPEIIVRGMKVDRVEALSQLTESSPGELQPAAGHVDLASLCGPWGLRSCLEGKTVLALFGKNGVPNSFTGDIADAVWAGLWKAVRSHNRSATVQGLGTPASGMAVQFGSDGRTYEWVLYSTHELEDDWYQTVQVLYTVSGTEPTLVRWNAYRYQIAGLEDTPMWLVWIINGVVLGIAGASHKAAINATSRRRFLSLNSIGALVLLLIGSVFGLAALSGVHQHDPWLVVFLMTATLMIACGAYMVIQPRMRRRGM
jgi:hypothetical protein